MRTEFTSGAWVEHLPFGELRSKHKDLLGRLVTAQLQTPAKGGDDPQLPGVMGARHADMLQFQRDACWAMLLTAWSYELPLPHIEGERGEEHLVDRDSFGELEIDDGDELSELFAPYMRKLLRVPDPKGTTTSSSNGSSKARATSSRKG